MTKYKITAENAKEARQRMKSEKDKNISLRLLTIALRGEGKTNKNISEITGYNANYLPRIFEKIMEEGFNGLSDKRTGNNQKVTFQQEEEFLAKYSQMAEEGTILTVEKIFQDFKNEFQIEMVKSSFYKLLKRHGWRKIMPRREHPKKASAEEIEHSKKLTPKSANK